MKRLQYHPEARDELIAAVRYYEFQVKGLGQRYLDHVAGLAEQIKNMPSSFPAIDEANRRARVTRFPFHIIFRERGDYIQIIAVAHFRRKPGYWTHRASS